MMRHFILLMALNFITSTMVKAQVETPLYKNIPNSKPADNLEKSEIGTDSILRINRVSIPSITIYKPTKEQKPNSTAIVICPGGSYSILAAGHEGADVAKELNKWGITAFVLKYRLPDERIMNDKSIGPLQDAERAMQWIREHAKQYGIHPRKIGVMGFSAGGHLAASLSTMYEQQLIPDFKNSFLRPDFSILIYPVISFSDSLGHTGSRKNLLGEHPDSLKKEAFSTELHINKNTPPAFLVHAKDDKVVPYQNSVVYYEALLKNKVPAKLKLFDNGGHGFGMNNKTTNEKWMDDLRSWLLQNKFL